MCQCKVECALEKYTLTIYPCFEEKHQQSYRKGENTVIIGGSLIITEHLNYWVKQKETVNNKTKRLWCTGNYPVMIKVVSQSYKHIVNMFEC